MVEYTIAHFAKNQELHRIMPTSEMLIDTSFAKFYTNNFNNTPKKTDFLIPNFNKTNKLNENYLSINYQKQKNNTNISNSLLSNEYESNGKNGLAFNKKTLKSNKSNINSIIHQYPVAFYEDFNIHKDHSDDEFGTNSEYGEDSYNELYDSTCDNFFINNKKQLNYLNFKFNQTNNNKNNKFNKKFYTNHSQLNATKIMPLLNKFNIENNQTDNTTNHLNIHQKKFYIASVNKLKKRVCNLNINKKKKKCDKN